MKILMVSIFAPHFFNWTQQLEDSGHEIYWLDVFDSRTKVEKIDFAHQMTGWRYKVDYPGRYFIKNSLPGFNSLINLVNERNLEHFFEQRLAEIKPDVVQSFVMHLSCFPIYKVMERNPQIKWIYSSWGSDLFYYQDKREESEKMKQILPALDFMFADCHRDYKIAEDFGFKGLFLGVFPGGGGFDLKEMNHAMKPLRERDVILVKGYQGKHGRCIQVLLALIGLKQELINFRVIIFGANKEVQKFVSDSELQFWGNLEVFGKISQSEVIKLMGRSIIYIGNSLSDGMPNTLLEAMVMGAFPLQSNPGGATGEIITHKSNGMLIEEPENPESIRKLILEALRDTQLINNGRRYNLEYIKPKLERELIRTEVLERYKLVERQL